MSTRPPMELPARVADCLRRHGVPRRLHVGFSGGADSTALLVALHEVAPDLGAQLAAVHFEHGLRGRHSLADAAWCRKFCAKRQLPCQIVTLEVRGSRRPGESLEAAARRLRLDAWRRIATGQDDAVALGHHADDRAENLLLRLLRGANCSGLTSLRTSQTVQGVRLLRPLLDCRRDELIAFLHSRHLRHWREDHTNRSPDMRRNFLRHQILPMIRSAVPETDAALAAALSALDDDAAFLEGAADHSLAPYANADALPATFLDKLPPALLPRVLRHWLEPRLGTDFIPDRRLLNRLAELLPRAHELGGESRRLPLPGHGELLLHHQQLTLHTPPATPPATRQWRWPRTTRCPWPGGILRRQRLARPPHPLEIPDANSAIFPAATLPVSLTVRGWQEGDRMIPFGHRRPVSLKKLFSDMHIHGPDRQRHPLIVNPDDDAILWVVGLRRSALLTHPGGSAPAILLTWEPQAKPVRRQPERSGT